MAQLIDVVGYGTVSFPDGMSEAEITSALRQLPQKTSGQKPQAPVPAPTEQQQAAPAIAPSSRFTAPEQEDLTKPAFGYYRRQDKPYLEEKQQRVETEIAKAPGYNRFFEDQALFDKVNKYAVARFGKEGVPKDGETQESYINRWASHMRMVNNNMLSAYSENEWLNTAKPEDKLIAGDLYKAWDETASFLRPQGQKGWRPIVDVLKTQVDITAPISLGVATAASRTFMKKATEVGGKAAAAKTATGATSLAATPVVEGVMGAAANAYDQKIKLNVLDARAKEMRKVQETLSDEEKAQVEPEIQEIENRVREGVSGLEMAASGLISGTAGIIEPAVLLAASKKASALMGEDLTLDSIKKARQQQQGLNVSPDTISGNKQLDEVTTTTTKITDGKDLLSEQGKPTVIAEMQIKNSIDKQADLIAQAVWRQMPELAPKAGEKTFDAVKRTLEIVDTLEDDVVESALLKENIEIKPFIAQLKLAGLEEDALTKFAAMYGTSTSDAARTLQSKSVISRLLNKVSALDKEAAREVDILFGKSNPIVDSGSYLRSIINRFDKNQITAMTVNVSTMLTNAWGSATNLTLGIAEDALESAIFRVGKSFGEKMSGKPITGSIKEGISGVTKDALNTYFYMGQVGLSKEVSEKLLENSPALAGKMLVTAAETANSDLYKFVQVLNTPAVIMDSVTRRAVFTASVEQSMRRVGLNMYDFIGTDKPIPVDILRKGVDDSLLFTFSKSPTNKAGKAFVDTVEAFRPASTMVVPFARFMTNTVRWTHQHFNPWLAASGTYDFGRGINMLRKGEEEGLRLIQDSASELSKVAVGAGIFVGALSYREKNQDTSWNTVESNGSTVDIKNLAPLNIPFAIADYYIKTKNGNSEDFNTKELAEAILGIKTGLIGTQQVLFDKLRDWAGSQENDDVSRNKLGVIAGEIFGNYFGRSTVPLNQISALITSYDRNESLPRDVFVLKEGEERGFVESFTKPIIKGIPILKQTLPEYQSATRVETPYRDTALMKQFTGLSFVPPKNDIEKEIERLKIEPRAIFTTTGSKTVDAAAKKRMAEFLPYYVEPILNNSLYQQSSKEAQALELTKILGKAQQDSKKFATNTSIVDAYEKKQVPLIEQELFEKLPPKVRRLTLAMFKEQTGEDLVESKDFKKYGIALALSRAIKDQPLSAPLPEEKAEGGVVGLATGGYLIGKALKKTATETLEKKSADLLQSMQEMAAKAAPKAVEEAPLKAAIPAKPLSAQTKEALPAPTKPPVLSPTEAPRSTSKVVNSNEPYLGPIEGEERVVEPPMPSAAPAVEPAKPFSPEQYAAGEKAMAEFFSPDQLTAMKYNNPEEYANYLHTYTGQAAGIKFKDMPPQPFAPKPIKDEMSDMVKEVEYDMDGNPIDPNAPKEKPKAFVEPKVPDSKLLVGDLGVKTPDTVNERKKALTSIREFRTDAFPDLVSNQQVAALPDAEQVAAVVQGDFRIKTGREADPMSAKDMAEFASMAKEYQARLDSLRTKYKDVPPIKLFHGSDSIREEVDLLKQQGFKDPQQHRKYHMELDYGGVSFTKDVNMNYETGSFGGKNVEKFVYTEMPYADYVFQRINMAPAAYKERNLNVAARSLNGSPNVVRPVSLPRNATFKETEDVFTEADKLVIKPAAQEVAARYEGVAKRVTKENELQKQLFDLANALKSVPASENPSINKRLAYKAYDNIRLLLTTATERGSATSTKTGIGQRYQKFVEEFADNIRVGEGMDAQVLNTNSFLQNVSTALEAAGAQQKAKVVNELRMKLGEVRAERFGNAAKPTDEIRRLSQKFNIGGLASRRT